MKGLILALVLQGAAPSGDAGAGSLGIGIDVLPEAFSFAASRVSYTPELRLTHCDSSACRWHLGGGVEMIASLSRIELEVNRVEADLDAPASPESTAGIARRAWRSSLCSIPKPRRDGVVRSPRRSRRRPRRRQKSR